MKISIALIIVFTTLFCVLPYLWFILVGQKNTKKIEKTVKDLIKIENISFNSKEQWNNNFIGIDESKNILIFIKLMKQEVSVLKLDLNEIKSCHINKKTKDFKRENILTTELQSLDLELFFLMKSDSTTLPFYHLNDEFSEDFEMKRAEKWQALIQQRILKTVSYKPAA